MIRNLLKRLANLSLQDYYWRSDFFKKTEADRQLEQSLARMMGEEAAYVRPMDAGEEKIGPLVCFTHILLRRMDELIAHCFLNLFWVTGKNREANSQMVVSSYRRRRSAR